MVIFQFNGDVFVDIDLAVSKIEHISTNFNEGNEQSPSDVEDSWFFGRSNFIEKQGILKLLGLGHFDALRTKGVAESLIKNGFLYLAFAADFNFNFVVGLDYPLIRHYADYLLGLLQPHLVGSLQFVLFVQGVDEPESGFHAEVHGVRRVVDQESLKLSELAEVQVSQLDVLNLVLLLIDEEPLVLHTRAGQVHREQ